MILDVESSIFVVGVDTGTGTARSLRLRTSGNSNTLTMTPSNGTSLSGAGGATSSVYALALSNATAYSSTSTVQGGLSVTGTVNQTSGTGGYNGVLCNPTLTAVGSGGAKCFRAQNGGNDRWWIDATTGAQDVDSTITAAGTTGNQTINKAAGTVNVAATASSITVTNSLITTSTIIDIMARTNDATCSVKNYVPASGSVTINMTAACTAETSVGFYIPDKN